MPLAVDLHSHSTASDGTLTPSGLVARAAAAGVELLALTDHDTVEGTAEAAAAARAAGIGLLPGVEISVTWNGQVVHIVGLAIDPDDPALNRGLAGLREFRAWRAQEIGRRLAKAGIDGAFEGALALSNGRLVSRTHFARFLVQRGVVADERSVFKKFLVRGRPGHVPGQWAALDEAVGWVVAAGGRAVLAHPARYALTATRRRRLLEEFKAAGGVALEVVSGSHGRDDTHNMAELARRFDLLASAGSDYHGPENPWIALGRLPRLPAGLTPVWHDWLAPRLDAAVNG